MKFLLRNGEVVNYDGAQVMGIINVTPDSFFAESRSNDEDAIRQRVRQIVEEGGTIIDVGAYSSRSDGADISEIEETERLDYALPIIIDEVEKCAQSSCLISVDTFRSAIARRCVEKFDVDIINDISGGTLDPMMFETIRELRVPYVLMHMRGTPQTMQTFTDYPDGVTNEVIRFFRESLEYFSEQQTVILDPGFGFAKTIEQNYQLFSNLSVIKRTFPDQPLLVGVSRKSMIYKLINSGPEDALNGTSVLNALAVAQGADILRVHDVKEAKEICGILE